MFVFWPVLIRTAPLDPLGVVPVLRRILPEMPLATASPVSRCKFPVVEVAVPLLKVMLPDVPVTLEPLNKPTQPESPDVVVPLLNSTLPLAPVADPFADRILTEPDELAPVPVLIKTEPP